MDSAQLPAEQEGFGFLAKVNGSESLVFLLQNNPDDPNSGDLIVNTGRVQNDGTGSEWSPLRSGVLSGALSLGDFASAPQFAKLLKNNGDTIAFYADYPDNAPVGSAFIGTIQYDGAYQDSYFIDAYAIHTQMRYQGYVDKSTNSVTWLGAYGADPLSGFMRINGLSPQYIETLSQYDFSVSIPNPLTFATDLQGKKLYMDMELTSGTPYYYTTAPLPIEIVTIQNHWLADNVVVYSAVLNTPSNGKIQLILNSPSPTNITRLNFTVIGSGLSGALKINGIYVR